MKALNIFVIGVSIFLFFAAFTLLPSDVLSKEKIVSKMDCSWKCDPQKKECICSGKDCQKCVGNKGKSYGGGMMYVSIQRCRTECTWHCTAQVGHECFEWSQTCITRCR